MLLSLLLGSAVALVPQQRSSAPQQRFVAAPTRLAAVVDSYAISREIKSVFVHDGDYSLDVCDEVVKVGQMAIASKGSFSLAVPGGSIVKALSKLKTDALDFSKVHVFFCNERIDDNKCYQGALDAFTTKCGVPLANVHGVGSGSPTEVAASYAALIASHPSVDQSGTLPSFDMMLLGTGEDGHVGSLYPDSEEIRLTGQGKIVLAIEAGGEAPRRRMGSMDVRGKPSYLKVIPGCLLTVGKKSVALSMDIMCASKVVLVSAAGEARGPMVCAALSGEFGPFDCPAGMVEAQDETLWFCDTASIADFEDYDQGDEEDDDEEE